MVAKQCDHVLAIGKREQDKPLLKPDGSTC